MLELELLQRGAQYVELCTLLAQVLVLRLARRQRQLETVHGVAHQSDRAHLAFKRRLVALEYVVLCAKLLVLALYTLALLPTRRNELVRGRKLAVERSVFSLQGGGLPRECTILLLAHHESQLDNAESLCESYRALASC